MLETLRRISYHSAVFWRCRSSAPSPVSSSLGIFPKLLRRTLQKLLRRSHQFSAHLFHWRTHTPSKLQRLLTARTIVFRVKSLDLSFSEAFVTFSLGLCWETSRSQMTTRTRNLKHLSNRLWWACSSLAVRVSDWKILCSHRVRAMEHSLSQATLVWLPIQPWLFRHSFGLPVRMTSTLNGITNPWPSLTWCTMEGMPGSTS